MAIKLTKNEQKVQKDHLKQYQRYLPTLQLKKQQLQAVITKTKADLEQKEVERAQMIGDLDDWVAVFAENESYLDKLAAAEPVTILASDAAKPENAMTGVVNGVEIYLPLKGLIDVEKETARLSKELEKLEKEIKRLNGKLNNEGFLKKAPEQVVAGEKAKLADYEEKKKSVEGRISDLAKI